VVFVAIFKYFSGFWFFQLLTIVHAHPSASKANRKNGREKVEKDVYYVLEMPFIPSCLEHICSRIVPELFPDMHRYEARKGDPQTCPERESNIVEGCFYLILVENTKI
jgi:hypothetical protein